MKYLFILTLLFSTMAQAKKTPSGEVQAEKKRIKEILQKDLLSDFLPKLESQWGDCEDENCLTIEDGIYTLELPKKDICFPYTACGYYKCMEKKYQCKSVGVNYFVDLANPTCSAYEENIDKGMFTKKGIEWIYSVMVCLQKGLTEECDNKENCSFSTKKEACDHITDFTLDFHPGCYINSGIGVCKLPLKDKISIFKTVAKYLTKDERKQAYRTTFHCLKN